MGRTQSGTRGEKRLGGKEEARAWVLRGDISRIARPVSPQQKAEQPPYCLPHHRTKYYIFLLARDKEEKGCPLGTASA